MAELAKKSETLAQRASKWRSALADAASGPLIVASEIVALADNWEAYKEESGGLSCAAWLQAKVTHKGQALDYFNKRHQAVLVLGEASRRTMHHEVAVYVVNTVTPEHRDAVKMSLMRDCRAQGGPLTLAQAKLRIARIIGKQPRKTREAKPCERCADLERRLRDAGLSVD